MDLDLDPNPGPVALRGWIQIRTRLASDRIRNPVYHLYKGALTFSDLDYSFISSLPPGWDCILLDAERTSTLFFVRASVKKVPAR